MTRNPSRIAPPLIACVAALAACQEPQIVLPPSLDGPAQVALARGEVCLELRDLTGEGLVAPRTRRCVDTTRRVLDQIEVESALQEAFEQRRDELDLPAERGNIGLVVNTQIDRLGVVAMDPFGSSISRTFPVLLDLSQGTPGITHIPVGAYPVDVAASPDGTVAYTSNQGDATVSVVNLWALSAVGEALAAPGTPGPVLTRARTGELVVGLLEPSALWIRPGVRCEAPADSELPAAPGELDPAQGCDLDSEQMGQTMELPGQLKDLVEDPRRGYLWALYTDRPWLSVIAPDEATRGEDACVDGRAQAPCEIGRVGLTHGCSDGLDNDGDGAVDTEDVQCFGPLHAESREGIGRRVQGACADGEDNDGDGAIDRADAECHASAQAAEGGEQVPDFEEAFAACDDGQDNDGDGRTDTEDPDCYGPRGRTERAAPLRGFESLGVDEVGMFVYVTRPSGREILVVDAARRQLVDAPRSRATPDPFTERLGVVLGTRPRPSAVDGHITRRVIPDDRPGYEDVHALIEYQVGAYTATDSGFFYYVDAATIYCDIWSLDRGLLSTRAFFETPWELDERPEARCLRTPALPLQEPAAAVSSCREIVLCRECVEGDPLDPDDEVELEACAPCQGLDEQAYEQGVEACLLSQRSERSSPFVTRVFNPRMAVLDALDGFAARQVGRARCEQPEALVGAMQRYLNANPDSGASLGCGSALMPQPLSLTVATEGPEAPEDFGPSPRLDLIERRQLELVPTEGGGFEEVLAIGPDDYRIRDESWTIAYEGVLPGTSREDGLVAAGGDPSRFDIGSLNPCLSDVRPGDVLIVRTGPGDESGGVPESCQDYAPEEAPEAFRSYEIVEVRGGELGLELLDPGEGDGPRFVEEFPTRECFPRGIAYEIRPRGEWIVSGSQSGLASGQRLVDGVCVPGNGADFARASARARIGERFDGPLFSFKLTEGQVEPLRGLSYTVEIERNFNSASASSGIQLETPTVRPSQIQFINLFSYTRDQIGIHTSDLVRWLREVTEVGAREAGPAPTATPRYLRYLMAVDPSDDRIYVRDLSNTTIVRDVR